MTNHTLDSIKAKQAELNVMIDQLVAAAIIRVVAIHETRIELRPGEHYAGAVLNEDGSIKHHLVLMYERPTSELNWKDADDWAKKIGGDLPTRQEAALLFANCKQHLEAVWHWTSESYESNASSAWCCSFISGSQYGSHKYHEGRAVSVRRI